MLTLRAGTSSADLEESLKDEKEVALKFFHLPSLP